MTETDPPPLPPAAPPPARRGFFRRVFTISGRDLIVLAILCLCAGLLLAAFNVDPTRLWVDFFGTLAEAWERFIAIISDTFLWSIRYFLLGAVLVVPLWIAWRIVRATGPER